VPFCPLPHHRCLQCLPCHQDHSLCISFQSSFPSLFFPFRGNGIDGLAPFFFPGGQVHTHRFLTRHNPFTCKGPLFFLALPSFFFRVTYVDRFPLIVFFSHQYNIIHNVSCPFFAPSSPFFSSPPSFPLSQPHEQ